MTQRKEVENNVIPKTLAEAITQLILRLPKDFQEDMKSKRLDDLIGYHHTLGQNIRNEFRMWGGNDALLESCSEYADKLNIERTPGHPKHPDDMSFVIIKMLWIILRKPEKNKTDDKAPAEPDASINLDDADLDNLEELIDIPAADDDEWIDNFITQDVETGKWIAWDETQANQISQHDEKVNARTAVKKYADELNQNTENADDKENNDEAAEGSEETYGSPGEYSKSIFDDQPDENKDSAIDDEAPEEDKEESNGE